jgi:uncharacterized membrane protein YphA (DoxX/SURF4 family)
LLRRRLSMNTNQLNSVYTPLRLCYGLVPIAAGADKFMNLLVDWKIYLPHFVTQVVPMDPALFMRVVGVIEIVAGLLVITVLPRLGSLVVMAWLVLVGLMAAISGHLDVCVRDIVMAVGAYTLSMVAAWRGEPLLPGRPATAGVSPHAAGR